MEPGLCRSQRDPQLGRDIRQRQAQVVVQDDNGAPLRLEPAERLVEKVTISDRRGRIRNGWTRERRELDLDDATLAAPRNIEAGMDGQAVQPGLEPLRVA